MAVVALKFDDQPHPLETELRDQLGSDLKMWEFLQQGSLDGIWYWDLENPQHEWMSPEFWQLFGIDPETCEHTPDAWQDIINEDDLKVATENFVRHCEDPSHPYDQIVRYKHANGSTVWVRCRGLALRDDTGKPIRMLGAHTDLTAIKRAEEAAKREKAKLELANAELLSFAYGVSHDLKSPTRTALHLIQEGLLCDEATLSEEQKDLFSGACETLQRMHALIDDLLDYGRIIEHEAPWQTMDLETIVTDTVKDLKGMVDEYGAKISLGRLPELNGSEPQVRMLVQNMLSNAMKYHQPGVPPEITVRAEQSVSGLIILSFSDNGVGIPEDKTDEVFGVFKRLHRQEQVSGTGLGLAICKRVAVNHHGWIEVHTLPTGGTRFDVAFPHGSDPK